MCLLFFTAQKFHLPSVQLPSFLHLLKDLPLLRVLPSSLLTPFPCCRDCLPTFLHSRNGPFPKSCQPPVVNSVVTCQSLNLPVLGKLSSHSFCYLCLWILSQISGWVFPVSLVGSCVPLAFKCHSSSGFSPWPSWPLCPII